MRIAACLAWAFAVLLLGAGLGHAERRVALVVGNGEYQHADKLANPITDARRMREALTGLGFEVVFGENLDKRALERAVGRFANAAQDADLALVYYAGHGATFGDVPYVVPVDARFTSLADMPYELLPVETLIGELRRAKGVRIAILDACRDNAAERELKRVASRGGEVTRGLARVRNPEGLILAYATQYMATARDGPPNDDSPFTAALLANIATPGLDVKDLFFRVGSEVTAKTKGEQRPEISVSFYDSYALVPAAVAPQAPAAVTQAPVPAPVPQTPAPTAPSKPPQQTVSPGMGGPYVPVPAPPRAQRGSEQKVSLWTHNGSVLYLTVKGINGRRFYYQTPRQSMAAVGVVSGTMLFDGHAEGNKYIGTAYVFYRNCGAIPYEVSGPISANDEEVTLHGRAPRLNSECQTTGYRDDTLVFKYQERLRR